MTDENSPEQYSELSSLLKELSGDLKKLSELEKLKELENLSQLDNLTALEELNFLDGLKKLEELRELEKLEELKKIDKLEELVAEFGIFDKLEHLDELKSLSELIKLNQLEKLKQLENLFQLNELSKLDQLDKLKDLSLIDSFEKTMNREGHRLDLLQKIEELEKLNRLSELDKLEVLNKLEYLKQLDLLEKLENLDQLALLTKVDEFSRTMSAEGDKLQHLQKIDELKHLERLKELEKLDELKELSKLHSLDRLVQLNNLDQLKKVDEFSDILEREGYRLDQLQKIDKLDALKNLNKLDSLSKLENLELLNNLNRLEGLELLNSPETQKTLDKLEKLDKLDELKVILDRKYLFILKGLIGIVVNLAGMALIAGTLFYGIFTLDRQDKITKIIPYFATDEKVVSSFALKSLEGLLERGQFQEVLRTVQEKLDKQIDRYWDLSLKYSLPERYSMMESIRSMNYSSPEFPLKEKMEEKMAFERKKVRETLDRDFERIKIQRPLSEDQIQKLLSIKILTYNGQCEKASGLMRDFDFTNILDHSFIQKVYLMNLDCLENQQANKDEFIWSILKK